MLIDLLVCKPQCSNIFLTKDKDVRLGEFVIFCLFYLMKTIAFINCVLIYLYLLLFFWVCRLGDFGLAKTLKADDLASSVCALFLYHLSILLSDLA